MLAATSAEDHGIPTHTSEQIIGTHLQSSIRIYSPLISSPRKTVSTTYTQPVPPSLQRTTTLLPPVSTIIIITTSDRASLPHLQSPHQPRPRIHPPSSWPRPAPPAASQVQSSAALHPRGVVRITPGVLDSPSIFPTPKSYGQERRCANLVCHLMGLHMHLILPHWYTYEFLCPPPGPATRHGMKLHLDERIATHPESQCQSWEVCPLNALSNSPPRRASQWAPWIQPQALSRCAAGNQLFIPKRLVALVRIGMSLH